MFTAGTGMFLLPESLVPKNVSLRPAGHYKYYGLAKLLQTIRDNISELHWSRWSSLVVKLYLCLRI